MTSFVCRAAASALLALLASAGLLAAQAPGAGAIDGVITDPTGAVIVGASIVLESDAFTTAVQSDRQGRYAFERLPPGAYRVTVEASGFVPSVAPVDVRPGETTTLPISLQAGIFLSLEVNERAAPPNDLSALVLTDKAIEALPDDPRLLLLRLLAMAGSAGRPDDVAVYVDGFREFSRLPPKDAIDMIRINSNPFSAEFSQPSTRRIEIATRPGSDGVHGEVKVQARASALDARNALVESTPHQRYRNVNGFIQGPLSKDRVGLFAWASHWQQDDNAFVHATVLDPVTHTAVPLSAVVSTPTTMTSALIKADVKILGQIINTSYTRTRERQRNQGLEGGFELPEHAYSRSLGDDVGRLWWTTLGRRSLNDARIEVSRNVTDSSAVTGGPAVVVLDAFSGGGNPDATSRTTTTHFMAADTFTTVRGAHTFKAGFELLTTRLTSLDRTGFDGTFTFGSDVERDASGAPVLGAGGRMVPISPVEVYRRTVLGFAGYGPSQFAIASGRPDVAVGQWNLGWFLLDDWTISRRVSLFYGVREELQSNIAPHVNLAPRASLSWVVDPQGRNVVKIGSGLFHAPVDAEITLDTRRLDGVGRRQIVVPDPRFFPAIPASLALDTKEQSTVYTKAPHLRTPYAHITTLGYERQLPHGLFAMAQYLFDKGARKLRLRDISVPGHDASAGVHERVLQFESTGRSTQHELSLALSAEVSETLSFYSNYRLSRRMSDTDGPYTLAADSTDLASEYGPAADDHRHDFTTGATLGFLGLLVEPAVTIVSGVPFNITTGHDGNGDTFFTDRPAYARIGDDAAIVTPYGSLTPTPRPGDVVVPRNAGREPWQVNVDLSVSRDLGQGLRMTAYAENLLNSSRYTALNSVLVSPVFGLPNRALYARRIALTVGWGF
jgi:hypothetical protein